MIEKWRFKITKKNNSKLKKRKIRKRESDDN